MAKYKIFVDTSADMPEEIAKEKGIGIIRFLSIFGEETFVSGVDLTNKEFFQKLSETNDIPTTSQTPYQDLYDILKEASDENDTVIYLTISSKASGQNHTACMIREEILEENPKADIRIVDTMKFSAFIAEAAYYLKDALDNGVDTDKAIEDALKHMNSFGVYVLVDTLKYLEKGGRINKTSAIVGTLLDIKPVLTVKDGLIEAVEKIRGRKKLYRKLIDIIKENEEFDSENPQFIIVQSNEEYGEEMRELLTGEFGENSIRSYIEMGAIIGTHIGPGVLGVLFKCK